MANYMIQTGYTPEAWASQIKNPKNRLEAIRPVVESLGGSIVDAWISFGEYDVVCIVDMPDNVSAAALGMAASAAGHLTGWKTTPLMSVEEGIEAMGKAGGVAYPKVD